jgi:hypothetical protein
LLEKNAAVQETYTAGWIVRTVRRQLCRRTPHSWFSALSTILIDLILGLFVAPDDLVFSEWLLEKNAAVQETLHSWMDCKDCKEAAVQENPTQLVQI